MPTDEDDHEDTRFLIDIAGWSPFALNQLLSAFALDQAIQGTNHQEAIDKIRFYLHPDHRS